MSLEEIGTDGSDMAALGARLRARRAAAGRTIASVAVDAGLSVPYIANLENGRGNPTLAALDKLARALGCRLQVAMTDPDGERPPPPTGADRVDRFARNARLRRETERIAAITGLPETRVREHLLDALAVLGRLKQDPLTALDCDRLVDLAVLITRTAD
jgi:transcriptional regulator with XRE-family HTH domain